MDTSSTASSAIFSGAGCAIWTGVMHNTPYSPVVGALYGGIAILGSELIHKAAALNDHTRIDDKYKWPVRCLIFGTTAALLNYTTHTDKDSTYKWIEIALLTCIPAIATLSAPMIMDKTSDFICQKYTILQSRFVSKSPTTYAT